MKKYQTAWAYKEQPCEEHIGETMTIQGEAYTIQELLTKFSTGQSINIGKQPIFEENATHESLDLQQINDWDIFEKAQLMVENQFKIKQHKAWLEQKKNEKTNQDNKERSSTTEAMGNTNSDANNP